MLHQVIQTIDDLEDLEISFSILFPTEDFQLYNIFQNLTEDELRIQNHEENMSIICSTLPFKNKITTVLENFMTNYKNDKVQLKNFNDLLIKSIDIIMKIALLSKLEQNESTSFFVQDNFIIQSSFMSFFYCLSIFGMFVDKYDRYILFSNLNPSMAFDSLAVQAPCNFVFGNKTIYNNAISILKDSKEEETTKNTIKEFLNYFFPIEEKAKKLFPDLNLEPINEDNKDKFFNHFINKDEINLSFVNNNNEKNISHNIHIFLSDKHLYDNNNKKLKELFDFYRELKNSSIEISLLFFNNININPIVYSLQILFLQSLQLVQLIQLIVFEKTPSSLESMFFSYFLEKCQKYTEQQNYKSNIIRALLFPQNTQTILNPHNFNDLEHQENFDDEEYKEDNE